MPYFVIPSRRTRQPQGAVRVASRFDCPVKSVIYPGSLDNSLSTQYGTGFTINGAIDGLAYEGNIASQRRLLTPTLVSQYPCFGVIKFLARSTTGNTVISTIGGVDSAGTNRIQIDLNLGSLRGLSAGTAVSSCSKAISTGVWYTVVYGSFAATDHRMWVSGAAAITDATSVAWRGAWDRVCTLAGSYYSSENGAAFSDVDVVLNAWFQRTISDAEGQYLSANPWSLFPDRRVLYFTGAGGGAGAYNLDAQPGGYTVSGTAATLLRGIVIDAQPATYTVSGTAASIVSGYNLDAATGTFAATGAAATLLRGLTVNAAPGSFAVTGTDATLEYTQPGIYTLDAQPGSYSLTGVAATLTYTPLNAYTLDAQPASYVLTGAAATLTYAGASIWTDVGVTAATWSDVGVATSIWTDL